MSFSKTKVLAIMSIIAVVVVIGFALNQPGDVNGSSDASAPVVNAASTQSAPTSTAPRPIPDFRNISDTPTKKKAFFDFFRPLVVSENDRIRALREEIKVADDMGDFAEMCELYNAEPCTKEQLLKRADIVPVSMALAQAAVESAWGTSRFAVKAKNYFGQWCFTEGCGLVPLQRSANSNHEVRVFGRPRDAVRSYIHNINSHSAYEEIREMRAYARKRNQPIVGSELVGGLLNYSEMGEHYVDELRAVIRVNRLER